jgi:ATP adenylyltransferase
MRDTCRMCLAVANSKVPNDKRPCDQILAETEHFAALPSVGAIVPGWVLVVSKHHVLNMGLVPLHLQTELGEFARAVKGLVESRFGPAVAFEHGPSADNQQAGCGVDHAHLHVVPTDCDLIRRTPGLFDGEIKWAKAAALVATVEPARRGTNYLFVEDQSGTRWIGTHPRLPSQLFRRVIAEWVGKGQRYDWKQFPEPENVRRTLAAFESQALACV